MNDEQEERNVKGTILTIVKRNLEWSQYQAAVPLLSGCFASSGNTLSINVSVRRDEDNNSYESPYGQTARYN